LSPFSSREVEVMKDYVGGYRAAVHQAELAARHFERLLHTIDGEVQKLRDWRHTGATSPMHGFLGSNRPCMTQHFNGHQWPSGGDVAEALNAYHKACAEAEEAWKLIPDELRVGLPTLPG
jgi:hypothetical protein